MRKSPSRTGIKSWKKLTPGEIVAQCRAFLLAGFDTTANSLAYATYHLAKDERVRQKLQEEIDSVCGDEVSSPTFPHHFVSGHLL
jgi:cytochrome P450